MCGVSQCIHLHVTDLATNSQILIQMNQSDFLKFVLIFLPQLLKFHLFLPWCIPPLEFVWICAERCSSGQGRTHNVVHLWVCPRGCLCSDSEALPFPGEPRAVFRLYFQYWLYHSIMSKEGLAALPALLCGTASANVWPLHMVPLAAADAPGATVPRVPLPSSIASGFRAHAEIQRYITAVLGQKPAAPCCKCSFKLPK